MRRPDAGQDPDLIERVLFLLLGQFVQFDLFERVLLAVRDPFHSEHTAVGPFA